MGAFIGYGDTGVWTKNWQRDAFLDWFAAYRCQPHDHRWEYCKSEGNRLMGFSLRLDELIPPGEPLEVSEAERVAAASEFGPDVAQLLGIISQITRGEWQHSVGSKEAIDWRAQSTDAR